MPKTRRKKATPAQLRALRKARAALKRRRKKTTTKRNPLAKRKAAARKAARTRAANKRKRSEAAKKAARTRKRRAAKKTVRRNPPKKTTSRRNKVARKKRRMPPRIKSGPRKGQFRKRKTSSRKRRVRRNPSKRARSTGNRWVRRKVGKGKKRKVMTVSSHKLRMKRRPGKRAGYKTYRIRRRRTKKGNNTYRLVRSNPKNALKKGLLFWGGLTGMKVLNGLMREHVISKVNALDPDKQTGVMAQVLGLVPSLAGFGIATFLLPKAKILKGENLAAVQMGAAIALFDAAFTNLVKPHLPKDVASLFGEYVPYDNRLGAYNVTVPQAGLDEYVADNRYGMAGFQVTEALAAEEIDFMQRGGAGGVFKKTVFG